MNESISKSFAYALVILILASFVFIVFFSIDTVIDFTKDLNDEVVRGAEIEDRYGFYLGVYLQDGVDIARFSVAPGSAMDSYGVETGDQLSGSNIADFYDRFASTTDEFSFFVLRHGEPIEITIPQRNKTSGL
ncbi:MAG: hypothetical protein ABH826_04235 [Patescibacteria group bacterium]|nr:hypothetical protein [Patescibacteria group bacterium]